MKVIWIHWRASKIDSNKSCWYERIKDLQTRWINIFVPQFNSSEDPTYESWKNDLKKINFSEYDVILASSHWWWVITKYLIDNNINIDKLIMISPWKWNHNRINTDKLYKELDEKNISLEKLVKNIFVLSCIEDDEVDYEISKNFAKKTWSKLITLNWYGHSMDWKWIQIINDFVEYGKSNLI